MELDCPVVDEGALIEALRDGTVAGATLDVFETEPLPGDSPLWDLDDVVVSPHCSAFTRDYYRHAATIVRESVYRIADGVDPANRAL